ncbi:vWA domain-containing protein [Streptomyces sp. NPDC002499]
MNAPAPSSAPALLLRGVDLAAFATAFAVRLREHGVGVGLTNGTTFVQALTVAPPHTRTELYWTARICLVRYDDQLPYFDAVFAAVFEDAVLALDPNARRDRGRQRTQAPEGNRDQGADGSVDRGGLPWVTLPRMVEDGDRQDTETPEATLLVPRPRASGEPGNLDVPFEQLGSEETALLGRWLENAVPTWPRRRSRRLAPVGGTRGRIALRLTLARARRTGWEPLCPVRVRPVHTPRPAVMLCDVSRSMQAQAVAYLHLMRAVVLRAGVRAEVFAFATSLTRLTPVLAHRSARTAIENATAQVTDRFGGTRIASSVRALLDSRHGECVRGAVVIIGSDGWDADSPQELAEAMYRLRRRAHQVIWMNPRASVPGFEPRVGAMAAALPFCHRFLPGDTFHDLERVLGEIATERRDGSGVNSRGSHGSRA